MLRGLFVLFTIFCFILIAQTGNAEVKLKLKDGSDVQKDIIGSYFYSKKGFISNLNFSKYFLLDKPNDKASYFVSVFFDTDTGVFDISQIDKGDTVNFIFSDVNHNVLSTKAMPVLNKGLIPGSKIFWVSILPPDDLADYLLPSHEMIIEFICKRQFFRMFLTKEQFSEWKQVAATVTKVKDMGQGSCPLVPPRFKGP